ncbi:MAG: amino acid adenylation domain-containing protein [Planctomycetota bacterium]
MPESASDPPSVRALSHSQQLIWMGQQLSPERPLYNMSLAFEIEGRLDPDLFLRAFECLVLSSDALRSTFRSEDGRALLRVQRAVVGELELVDASAAASSEPWLARWMSERSARVLDLERRAYDAALLRIEPERWVWFFNQHHLVTDAWSTAVAFERLAGFYERLERGEEPKVDELPQHASFVEAEALLRSRPAFERAAQHWRQQGDPSPPTAFFGQTPSRSTGRTERTELAIGAERTARFEELVRRPGIRGLNDDISRFQVLATVLCALLHRVGGERDEVAFLAPVHSRSTPDARRTIGLFVEVFPLRVAIDRDDTFRTLLERLAKAYRELLVHGLPGACGVSSARSVDVLLNYIPSRFASFAGRSGSARWIHPGYGDPAHAIRLQVHDFAGRGELALDFDLSCDAFGAPERASTVRCFTALFDALLANPDARICDVDLRSEAERDRGVEGFEWSERSWPYETVLEAFEDQCRRTPLQPALREGDRVTTYAELDARSERLARRLVDAGVARGDLAVIVLDRSDAFAVAALGALKAGAAYLPMEPSLPERRLRTILDDARPAAAVTLQRHARGALASSGLPVVTLDSEPPRENGSIDRVAGRAPKPTDVAYVLYTSGSTGRPKGVEVTHAALANYVFWASDHYVRGEPCDAALVSPISVDLTVTSVFLPLVTGGTVVVYPPSEGQHDLAVLDVFDDDDVDLVKLTPAHVAMLLRGDALRSSRLKVLIVGGEDLKRNLAQHVQDRLGRRVAIYNEYGPTEATVGCIVHRFDEERDRGASVAIGSPIANARIYLLDDRMRPVPAGIPGEVWIGGAGVARGYLADEELSEARFVASPFVAGDRLYRSGDLARLDPATDEIVYLGRIDTQVKVRGVRIELSEVEAALERHPAIEDVHVDAVRRGARTTSEERRQRWSGVRYCVRCGLASNHPDARMGQDGVCGVCREFNGYRDRAEAYFGARDDLAEIFREAGLPSGEPSDCMMLLSGGKDSTYALYQLAEMGLRPLVFSLDNGFISDSAKANIRRVVDDLGLELVFGETTSMNAIFADSLRRFSNVCQGCFKTIYTLATTLAKERGISHIVTGLSRGQIFETRLARFFRAGIFDPSEIDRQVIEARKAYHRVDDAVARHLDVSLFTDDAVFDEVRFVDFYRYCDTPLSDVLRFIRERAAWVRPQDTGRSTNCLINDAGIFVHKETRGFHNYALPYSWDVRLGHKTREECLDELDDEIDEGRTHEILREVGFRLEDAGELGEETSLTAYFVPSGEVPTHAELARFVEEELPRAMVPSAFHAIERVPLTAQGKVDRTRLAEFVRASDVDLDSPDRVEPRTDAEREIAAIWRDVLGLQEVGVDDEFLALGGDSILAIQIVARARSRGWALRPRDVFAHPTVAGLAAVAGRVSARSAPSRPEPLAGSFPLTPIQRRFVAAEHRVQKRYAQSIAFSMGRTMDSGALEQALGAVVRHHDALRLSIGEDAQEVLHEERLLSDLLSRSTASDARSLDDSISMLEAALASELDPADGRLLRAALIRVPGEGDVLVLVAHHLAVDAVSWTILAEDLARAYDAIAGGAEFELAPVTAHWSAWALREQRASERRVPAAELEHWSSFSRSVPSLPHDDGTADGFGLRGTERRVQRTLSAEVTQALIDFAGPYAGPSVQELVLAALASQIARWAGEARVLQVDVESHGRDAPPASEPLDASRLVGWCTSIFPVQLHADPAFEASLDDVRLRLRRVPDGGRTYGILRYLASDAAVERALAPIPRSEILFNYLGRAVDPGVASTGMRVARGLDVVWDEGEERTHALEVFGSIQDGGLTVEIRYSPGGHAPSTVGALLDGIVESLEGAAKRGVGPSTADFPEADLSDGELDDILREFDG